MDSNIYKNKKPIIFFLLPAFGFMLVFLYYPFIMNIIHSFQEISGLGSKVDGWNSPWYLNYTEMVKDENIWTALKNTLRLTILTVIIQVGMALLLAILIDNIKHGASFYRIVFFFPIVISASALGLLFNLIFLYDKGMINQMLEVLGKKELTDWKDETHAFITMTLPVIWQYVGFYFVIFVTGLSNISPQLYEAADIDGATKFQRVVYITIPLLRNTICTCVVLAVTGALKTFDLPWVMFPRGLPFGQTWLTGTYMYYQTFNAKDVDYSSAIAVFIVVLGIILLKVVKVCFKQRKDYDI